MVGGDGLAGPVARAVDDLKAEHDSALDGLGRARRTVDAVADLLDGPRTYLLLGANNAEMRAGSGMFLTAAPLRFEAGSLDLGDVRPTASLVLPARSVDAGDLAGAVFERIEGGDWEFDELATALVDVVQRRHLMVWSADDATQQAWSDTGADGRLRADSVSVALVNRGGEKLDAYPDTAATVTTGGGSTGRDVEVTYRITNRAPAEGPRYQLAPTSRVWLSGSTGGSWW